MRAAMVVLLSSWFLFEGMASVEAGTYSDAMKLLHLEDIAGARPLVIEYARDNPGEAKALLLEMRMRFLENRFGDALELLNAIRSTEDADILEEWRDFEDLVQSTWNATQNHRLFPSKDGSVVYHLEPGVDEVLLLYVEEAIAGAREVYAEIFGVAPYPDILHIHIYGKIETLAAVSSLKVSEIQNSGTIALCKYNRLMITSPRDLLYGYDWLDTLAHEYIHYVISKRNGNTVPIWIHEGLAKFFENRWREKRDGKMRPSSQDLLQSALKEKRLIPFESMSPSMAKLPTQNDTALAFAEVFTVMDFMKERVGLQGIRVMLDALKDGDSDREAMEAAMDLSFADFEKEWKTWLGKKSLLTVPTKYRSRLYFKNRNQSTDDIQEIGEKKAQDFVYLGDLLRARDRLLAASKEYAKAVAIVGSSSPVIQAKLAATLLALKRPKEALEAVLPPLSFHPKYVLLRLHEGKAQLALEQYAEAAIALEKAVELNPFDREAHEHLLEAFTKLGDTAGVSREKEAIRILGRDEKAQDPGEKP